MSLLRILPSILLNLLLGLCITLGTVLYQRWSFPESDSICGGGPSAGYPLAFICDSTAESPTSSWGKIDLADFFSNVNQGSLLLDVLFYSAMLTLVWFIVIAIDRKGLAHVAIFKWEILVCIAYIIVFLVTFVRFQENTLTFEAPFTIPDLFPLAIKLRPTPPFPLAP